jgi:phosphoenolpyruvate carboxylase
MDGNSDIHAKTIRETLHRQQQRIISAYYDECRMLSGKLSQSASRVGVSRDLEQRIAEYDILLPTARQVTPSRHDRMPYRIFLTQVAARLRTTYDGHPNHYESAEHFIRDIEIVAASLRENHGRYAGLFPVERLLCRARTFGFHLATLDVRQHASVHREVVRQGLALADWKRRKVDARRAVLREALARDRGPLGTFDAVGRRTLAVFEALIQGRYKYGDRATGDYVVSGTEGPDDVLSVLLLARWADITDRSVGEIPLDIAPVVETAAALEGAGEILRGLLTEDTYRRHLAARGNRQTMLVGYSESNKECGIAASRHLVYCAQAELMKAAAEAGIELALFHGRGGTASRGGGPLDRLVASTPPGATHGRLRATEQGDGISNSYGLRRIALRTFEKALFAVMLDRTGSDNAAAPVQPNLPLMRCIAEASRARYRALVFEDAEFPRYFRDVTPIDVIERMQIGGRVAHRDGSGIEALRAVPWVYAWSQSRHSLPGWFGMGTGLDTAARELGAQLLAKAWSCWPFFGNLLDDVEMELVRADLEIAAHYDALATGPAAGIVEAIGREHALAKRWITWIKGEVDPLDSRPQMQRSAMLRAPYLDPIHLMQVDLLRRWRAGGRVDRELFEALLASVTGIALGLQATG